MILLGSNALRGKIKQQAIVVDPVGAILISIYIIIAWILQANSKYRSFSIDYDHPIQLLFYDCLYFSFIGQVRNLTGLSAEPLFLQRLTHVIYNYRPDVVTKIDSIQAVHHGTNFFTEVDIGLPADMPLATAHNIGEKLQNQLEAIDCIERAFVHLDFEFSHMPSSEHKIL